MIKTGRKRVDERRERAYGKGAGIFLKKRRITPTSEDVLSSLGEERDDTSKKVVTKGSKESLSLNSSGKGRPKFSSNSFAVIGWDHVRCRPIYERKASNASTQEEDHDVEDRDGEQRDDVETVPRQEESPFPIKVPKKTRAYGSKKRSRPVLLDDLSKSKRKVPKIEKTNVPPAPLPVATPAVAHRKPFDLDATPHGGSSSVCAALNSEAKADKKTPGILVKKRRRGKKKSAPPSRKALADLDFVDENVGQPSSSTSLDAAKAFFERLDKQQKLTLDSGKTPKRCVRTTRAIFMGSNSLAREYNQYQKATKASGVDPLSLEQYAVNRSSFFRTGDMYDGYLDE